METVTTFVISLACTCSVECCNSRTLIFAHILGIFSQYGYEREVFNSIHNGLKKLPKSHKFTLLKPVEALLRLKVIHN